METNSAIANPPAAFTLTPEQDEACSLVLKWAKDGDKQEFRLGGYAGTGKTTVAKTIIAQLRDNDLYPITCAFTGKACNVLQRKGISAATLHSTMYNVENIKGVLHWTRKDKLDPNPDVILVDEASMVSTDLYNDIKSYGKKLLFIGDPGQLEPVGENPELMRQPDFTLTKIHRQAEASPIISLATHIRQGGRVHAYGEYGAEKELIIRTKELMASQVVDLSQLICAKNRTRQLINNKIRLYKKLPEKTIVPGEKIIVLRNNRDIAVFNGMILFVEDIVESKHDHWLVDAKDEVGNKFASLPVWKKQFETPELMKKDEIIPRLTTKDRTQLVWADYAYIITCHKSQGSEWDHVLIYDEYMPPTVWDMARWRYTAVTRAAKRLTYCI